MRLIEYEVISTKKYDRQTGKVMIDGTVVTGLRTGAVSAVSARYLAKNSEIVAMIGAPIQATYQLAALNGVLDIRQVCLYDVVEETGRRCAEESLYRYHREDSIETLHLN